MKPRVSGPCFLYSPASVLSAIEERYILRKNEKIRCHLRYEQRILILIIHTVIVNCRTAINVMLLYFNLINVFIWNVILPHYSFLLICGYVSISIADYSFAWLRACSIIFQLYHTRSVSWWVCNIRLSAMSQ